MINPHGVQREYSLLLEDLERRAGRARGLAHEVGRAQRRKEGAEAKLWRSLAAASSDDRMPQGRGGFGVLDLLRRPAVPAELARNARTVAPAAR